MFQAEARKIHARVPGFSLANRHAVHPGPDDAITSSIHKVSILHNSGINQETTMKRGCRSTSGDPAPTPQTRPELFPAKLDQLPGHADVHLNLLRYKSTPTERLPGRKVAALPSHDFGAAKN